MALLPPGPIALAGLVLIFAGLAYVLARRDIPKAYGISLLILLVFAVDTLGRITGRFFDPHPLGFRADDVLAGEAWWAPITSVFVHADLWHMIGNLFILVTAGPALEDRIGSRKFLVIFFLAAGAALAAHTLLAYTTTVTAPGATALGASGGIFGILSAFAIRYPRERLPMPLFFIIWLPAFFVLLIYLGFNLLYMLDERTRIAWWGHFAGFLVGLAFVRGLPAARGELAQPGSPKGLPDAEKLAPLATTPDLKRIHERLRQFTPETRTADDLQYADAWLQQFFAKARCPVCGGALVRRGLTATCEKGDYSVDFARR